MSARFVYADSAWEVDGDRRELRAGGRPVPIGSRAFEIIEKLAQSAGQFVSKDELVAHVWRGAVVDENTLRVHIHAIRKALGPDKALLKTAAGRGYRLLGLWTTAQETSHSIEFEDSRSIPANSPYNRSNLPAATSHMIGRESSIRILNDLVTAFRVVTLAGPGGIGKTTVALEVARDLINEFDGSVFLIELGSLSDPDLLPATVARAIGLVVDEKQVAVDEVARAIGAARLLLVLDNCEHLVDAVARLVDLIVRQCPSASILVTSREVLKIDGERVYRLPPLEVPDADDESLKHLSECSAVELFVRRTQSLDDRFYLSTSNSTAVATICRHLDGIPLAIEFAAGRAATLGVSHVVADLQDRFRSLTSGRRTAIPRHKTLRAVLDWSYDLLSTPEQAFLRSLGVFAGLFTLEDASVVACQADPADWLSGLVDKSLVVAEIRSATTLYRLLDTTRSYAHEKLKEHDELEGACRAHATHYKDLFERIEPEWQARPIADLHADHAWRLDNLRGAVSWAFAQERAVATGVALATAAIPLWMHLSLFDECRRYLEQAQATTAAAAMKPERQMRLHAAYGVAALYSGGDPAEAEAACERALHIAESIGDVDHQLRALWGLWLVRRGSLNLARRFLEMAVRPVDHVVGHRMVATSLHVQGYQREARPHVDYIRANPTVIMADPARFHFLVTERPMSQEPGLARILWAQGCADQAMELVRQSVAAATTAGHANSFCHFLALAGCLVSVWAGYLGEANRYVDLLSEQSDKFALPLWRSWSRGYRGMLSVQQDDAAGGAEHLGIALEELKALHEWRGYVHFLLERAIALGRLGLVDGGLALVEGALQRNDIMEGWMHPELLRVKGDLLVIRGGPRDHVDAETCFREAMAEASRQGALAWEMRAATSLARLSAAAGQPDVARQMLQSVYDRFAEGFETADLRSARSLLETLNGA